MWAAEDDADLTSILENLGYADLFDGRSDHFEKLDFLEVLFDLESSDDSTESEASGSSSLSPFAIYLQRLRDQVAARV